MLLWAQPQTPAPPVVERRVTFKADLARRAVRTADMKCGVARTASLARRFVRRTEI